MTDTTNTAAASVNVSLQEVTDFLMGRSPLRGVYFGDKPKTHIGNFWWRDDLRAALAAPAHPVASSQAGEYQPLPEADTHHQEDDGRHIWSYSSELMRSYVDADRAARGGAQAAHAAKVEPAAVGWLPMDTAPRDATIIRLLVEFEENSLEDTPDPVQTIGHNNFDHDEHDIWQFAGWDWSQDCYTQGVGKPIGWAPFNHPTSAPALSGVTDAEVATALKAFNRDYLNTPTSKRMCRALESFAASRALPGDDNSRLNAFRNGWELSYKYGDEDEDGNWQVHEVHGINDRVWNLLGEGTTVREAIDASITATQSGVKGGA